MLKARERSAQVEGAQRTPLIKVLSALIQLGGMQLVIAVTGIARNKVLALRLGAEGFGEFNQIALLSVTASTIAGLGLGLSLNRNVAAAEDDESKQRLLAQANSVNLTLSILLLIAGGVIILLFPGALQSVGISTSPMSLLACAIILLGIPLEAATQHKLGFLIGLLDVKGMAAGRSVALLIGTLLTLPLTWYFGLVGAALQVLIISGFLVLTLDRRCRALNFRPWQLHWDLTVFKVLVVIGVASLASSFSQRVSDFFVRARLIQLYGTAENGLFQAALTITYQVQAIVLGSVGSYLTATLSRNKAAESISAEANSVLQVILPVATLFLGGLGLFAKIALALLYSPDFMQAQELFPYMLATEYLSVLVWVVGAPLLALNRTGVWLGLSLIQFSTNTVLAIILIPIMGVAGVAAAYLGGAILHLALTLAFYLGPLGLRLTRKSASTFVRGAIVTVALSSFGILASSQTRYFYLGSGLLVGYALLEVQLLFGIRVALNRVQQMLRTRIK